MISAHAHPTFELSYAVPLLAKLLLESEIAAAMSGIPYCLEIPSLTLLGKSLTMFPMTLSWY